MQTPSWVTVAGAVVLALPFGWGLGVVAAELLKTLVYRCYDCTGAAVQGETDAIVLRKDVGAPSVMVAASSGCQTKS